MRAGEEATSPRLGRCPRGVPSPPFQAQARTAAGEGGGGTEGGTSIHRGTEQEVEDSLGSGTARTPGPATRKEDSPRSRCPWDAWSLRSAAGGRREVTALSGVSGLLRGAVWLLGAAWSPGCLPGSPGPRPAAPFLGFPPLGRGPRGATCSCPGPPGPPPCGSFGGARLRPVPQQASRPAQSRAGASEKARSEWRRALACLGEDEPRSTQKTALGAEPAPNPAPGPAGRGRGGGGGGAEPG